MNRLLLTLVFAARLYGACAVSWGNGYLYCRELTVDHTKVPSNQASFPFPVCFDSSIAANCSANAKELATEANGGRLTNASGFDFIFTSDNAGTTPIPYERAIQNTTTGAAELWVNGGTLSSTVDTKIYLFYHNNSVTTDQSNPTAVWDVNYRGVHHFNQQSGNVVAAADSTSNANNLTLNGVSGNLLGASGVLGGAVQWTGAAASLTNGAPSNIPTGSAPRTLEIWANTTGNGFIQFAYCIGANGTDQRFSLILDSTPTWAVEGTNVEANFPAGTGAFHHFVLALPMGSTTFMGTLPYVDGSLQTLTNVANWTDTVNTVLGDYRIGALCGVGGSVFILNNGALVDEARISDIARSADWIKTEYNSQSNPNTFYSVGAENVIGTGGGPRPVIFR
jgi:hypothetical protein